MLDIHRQTLGKENVFFLTGTDEHGEKIAQAAKENNQRPEEYADKVSGEFKRTWDALDVSYDHFFRTTDPRHRDIVQKLMTQLYDKGLIYKGSYEGKYCIGCEKYLNGREISPTGRCYDHGNTEIEERSEENYFFKISNFTSEIRNDIENNVYMLTPSFRRLEALSNIDSGVDDLSISRPGVEWGIPIPWDPSHTVYVWFDALLNYYTAPHFLGKESFFPPSEQFLAKDIFWFHSFIQQGILKALEKPLPKNVITHGFFTIGGAKMSKSTGNVIDPMDLAGKFGVDATRYLIVSAFAFGGDGDINIGQFDVRYKGELSDLLGNLIARISKLVENQKSPFFDTPHQKDEKFSSDFRQLMEDYRPDKAVRMIFSRFTELNSKISIDKPWKIESDKECLKVLTPYIEVVLDMCDYLEFYMPSTASSVRSVFKSECIKKPDSLFPRID